MMLASRAMCARSFALQKGYMFVRAALAPLARAALGPPARALGLAAALGPLLDASSPPPGSPADAARALDVCLAFQVRAPPRPLP